MDTKNVSVIIPACLSHTQTDQRRDIPVDENIADLVERLTHPAHGEEPFTVASCGHGLPSIHLFDRRVLAAMENERDYQIAALALGHDDPCGSPRFELHRDVDKTGVSGTGVVAHGWAVDRRYVVRWRGPYASTTIHESLESVEAVHLHRGLTRLVWVGREPVSLGRGVTAVFASRAIDHRRPGWLLSLDPTDDMRELAERCPAAMTPQRWNGGIVDDAYAPHHGDHLFALGDFEVGARPSADLRRHAHKTMRVTRRLEGSDSAVVSVSA